MNAPSIAQIQKFARYEFKYLLNASLRQRLEEEISRFMEYDGFVHPEMDNCYFVRSLYFDNDEAVNYREKTDGIKVRRKYRIRTYETSLSQTGVPIFLEEKGRTIDRTYKQRCSLQAEHLPLFYAPQQHGQELLDLYPGSNLIESFVFDAFRKRVRPRVLVDYIRKPFTSDYDAHFRVTFDGAIRAAASATLFPPDHAGWFQAEAGFTVLEVKFNRRIPFWFHKILQAYSMRRLSISKFCRGMEVCHLAKDDS